MSQLARRPTGTGDGGGMPARNHSTIGFGNCSCGGVRDACGEQRGTFQGRCGFAGTLPIRETAWKDEGGGSKPRWSSRPAMSSKSIRKSKRRSSIPVSARVSTARTRSSISRRKNSSPPSEAARRTRAFATRSSHGARRIRETPRGGLSSSKLASGRNPEGREEGGAGRFARDTNLSDDGHVFAVNEVHAFSLVFKVLSPTADS